MKFIFIIIFLVIAFLFEKRYINKKPFEEYRNQKCSVECNENLYNKYIYKPHESNWYNKIILGCQSLLNYKPQCQENFMNNSILNNKPNLWIYIPEEISSKYWKNFHSRRSKQDIPAYKQLCLNTIFKYNKDMNIYLLDDTKINSIFNKNCPFQWNDQRICKKLKLDYLKYYLFYHYGGIWIPPETIAFQSFKKITDKLFTNDIITVGCKPKKDECIDFTILGGSQYSNIIKYLLDSFTDKLNQYLNNYTYDSYYINKQLLNYNISYLSHHFSQEYNGTIDRHNRIVSYENVVAISPTYFKNPDKLIYYSIPENIEKYNHYNWFARLSKDQILQSDMWIGEIFSNILN